MKGLFPCMVSYGSCSYDPPTLLRWEQCKGYDNSTYS